MDELTQEGASENTVPESTSVGDGQQSEQVMPDNQAVDSEGEGKVEESQQNTASDQDIEIVEQDGKKLIPYERFKQVLDKKNELSTLFDSIKNDPAKRQEFAEALGLSETVKKELTNAQSPQPTAFQKFLGENV